MSSCDLRFRAAILRLRLPGHSRTPLTAAVLKIPRVANLLASVVNLLSHCDLLPRRTLCEHHFPGNYIYFSSQGRVHGVVSMGGVEKHYG